MTQAEAEALKAQIERDRPDALVQIGARRGDWLIDCLFHDGELWLRTADAFDWSEALRELQEQEAVL